jgi:hypothetical protein
VRRWLGGRALVPILLDGWMALFCSLSFDGVGCRGGAVGEVDWKYKYE